MAILNTFIKQPADRLDYDFDYSVFLAAADSIETAVFTVEPAGLTIDTSLVEPTFTKVWLQGGVVGNTYKVSCTITSAHGRVKQDEIKLRIREY